MTGWRLGISCASFTDIATSFDSHTKTNVVKSPAPSGSSCGALSCQLSKLHVGCSCKVTAHLLLQDVKVKETVKPEHCFWFDLLILVIVVSPYFHCARFSQMFLSNSWLQKCHAHTSSLWTCVSTQWMFSCYWNVMFEFRLLGAATGVVVGKTVRPLVKFFWVAPSTCISQHLLSISRKIKPRCPFLTLVIDMCNSGELWCTMMHWDPKMGQDSLSTLPLSLQW